MEHGSLRDRVNNLQVVTYWQRCSQTGYKSDPGTRVTVTSETRPFCHRLKVTSCTHVPVLPMSPGDFVLQMPPQSPRSQLEVITGEDDPQNTPPRRGGIVCLTVDVPSARHTPGEPPPSRWRTPEFFLYYAIFAAAVPWMIYVPVQLSSSAYYFAVFPRACRPYSIRLFFQRHFQITRCIDID
jgi:hypothetical protein